MASQLVCHVVLKVLRVHQSCIFFLTAANHLSSAPAGANGFQADLGTWQAWKQNETKVQVINFTVLDQVWPPDMQQ